MSILTSFLLAAQTITPTTNQLLVTESNRIETNCRGIITNQGIRVFVFKQESNIFIVGRNSSGAIVYPETMVNQTTIRNQLDCEISYDTLYDRILVTWTDRSGLNGQNSQVMGRVYNSNLTPNTGEFRLFNEPNSDQNAFAARIINRRDGNWLAVANCGNNREVMINLIEDNGITYPGGQVNNNQFQQSDQLYPCIAQTSTDTLLVGWQEYNQTLATNPSDIFGIALDRQTGTPIIYGAVEQELIEPNGIQTQIDMVGKVYFPGYYLVCSSNSTIIGREITEYGNPIGSSVVIGQGNNPRVTLGDNDSIIVTWVDNNNIKVRWMDSNLSPLTNEMQVNQIGVGYKPHITVNTTNMMISWSNGNDCFYRDYLIQ